jgi:hypothetical protein
VADDVTLGMMLKRSGARCSIVLARSHLALTMYPTFRSLVKGVEKSACAMSRYRVGNHLLVAAGLLALDVLPWLGLGLGLARGDCLLSAVGGVGAVLCVGSAGLALRVLGLRPWPAVLAAVGGLVFHSIILVTGLRNYLRGRVAWRDTTYTLAELRAGQRFRWPWQR